jgi:hypothetical protein
VGLGARVPQRHAAAWPPRPARQQRRGQGCPLQHDAPTAPESVVIHALNLPSIEHGILTGRQRHVLGCGRAGGGGRGSVTRCRRAGCNPMQAAPCRERAGADGHWQRGRRSFASATPCHAGSSQRGRALSWTDRFACLVALKVAELPLVLGWSSTTVIAAGACGPTQPTRSPSSPGGRAGPASRPWRSAASHLPGPSP